MSRLILDKPPTDAGEPVIEPAPEPVLPIVQGDWVAWTGDSSSIQIGRVRQANWDREPGGAVVMDVVLYHTSGEVEGRSSPACGGPKSFEPAVTFGEEAGWQRIEKPDFPLNLEYKSVPSQDKPGWFTLVATFYHKDGLSPKPARTKRKKQSSDYPRQPYKLVYVPSEPSNGPEFEAAGLRRAAQELRDLGRRLSAVDGSPSALTARAAELEAEADKLSPRA